MGKPLLAWSIDVARQVSEIDRIIVSTDDAQIASVGRAFTAQRCMRDLPHLATDEALVIDALKDLLQRLSRRRYPRVADSAGANLSVAHAQMMCATA